LHRSAHEFHRLQALSPRRGWRLPNCSPAMATSIAAWYSLTKLVEQRTGSRRCGPAGSQQTSLCASSTILAYSVLLYQVLIKHDAETWPLWQVNVSVYDLQSGLEELVPEWVRFD